MAPPPPPTPLTPLTTFLSLAHPGEARGYSTNSFVIDSFIHSFSNRPFPPTALRCPHAKTVGYKFSSYKIEYVMVIKKFLNPEGYQNPINGSKGTAILLIVEF